MSTFNNFFKINANSASAVKNKRLPPPRRTKKTDIIIAKREPFNNTLGMLESECDAMMHNIANRDQLEIVHINKNCTNAVLVDRAYAIAQMMRVSSKNKYTQESVFMGVRLMDRYLSTLDLDALEIVDIDEIGETTYMIACKISSVSQIDVPHFMRVWGTDHKHTILNLEMQILSKLGWNFPEPTSVEMYLCAVYRNNLVVSSETKLFIYYFLYLSLFYLHMAEFSPCTVVYSVLCIAQWTLGITCTDPDIINDDKCIAGLKRCFETAAKSAIANATIKKRLGPHNDRIPPKNAAFMHRA